MRNKLFKLALYCHRLGLKGGLKMVYKMFSGKKGQVIALHVPRLPHPVYIRAQTADEYTFQQIFINDEYDFEYAGKPKTLIDAGANIGLAAVYFANRFPDCKIICLEPELANATLLKQNIAHYPNIQLVYGGLWSKSTCLKVRDTGLGNWGFVVEECDENEPDAIRAHSLPDVMKQFSLSSLDIVKMDIEGSEKEVLEAADVHLWLSKCPLLVIEIHDRMKSGTSKALFKALEPYTVHVEQKGENMVCALQHN